MEARVNVDELRIGNWVTGCNKKPFQIDGYGIMNIADGFASDTCPNPIPLTPEILENCGLRGMHTKRLHTVFKITPAQDGGYVMYVSDELKGSIAIETCRVAKIQYLHQLQNLYYALTNTELPITL